MTGETRLRTSRAEFCGVPEETVIAFVAGDLLGEDGATLATHLGECGPCRALATDHAALRADVADACAEGVVRWHSFATPFGEMFVAATDAGLVRLSWRRSGEDPGPWPALDADRFVDELERKHPGAPVVPDARGLADVERELREYFEGRRTRFETPVDLSVVGPFDRGVLEAAVQIPFGDVVPYAEIARRIRRPGASRAVGNALGRNPIAIVVPCHRVVRTDGSLGGYGGGIEFKERLLRLEGRADLLFAS